ncbi:MAG: biofilm regulation diguanylate cyclase SiaD [Candidatus Methylumidiphilus sp.]
MRTKQAAWLSLENDIEALLADGQYRGHPLREVLEKLWGNTREQLLRLERITQISDDFQTMAHQKTQSILERHNRQLRQLEKITRISDRYQHMLRELNTELKEASTHDYLTGLANRRLAMERLKEEDERLARVGGSYCVALIDADNFKQVNDVYGHDVGDAVLVELAKALRHSLRKDDVCSRWGGEEFLLLLSGAGEASAVAVAERILDAVRQLEVPAGDARLRISVSIGIAQHRPGDGYAQIIQRADAALLDAKRAGRDCHARG